VSDNDIVVIPVDPQYVPTKAQCETALSLMKAALPAADEVTTNSASHPELVHPYANWSGVRCPRCHAALDDDWWVAAVDEASATSFDELHVGLPCCGSRESLNDLDYVWPAGFARFQLDAANPDIETLPPELIAKLETVLGIKVRVVYQHL